MLAHRRMQQKRIATPEGSGLRHAPDPSETDAHSGSEEMLDLVRRRSSPGIIVVGAGDGVLYTNAEAESFLTHSGDINLAIRSLCRRVRSGEALESKAAGCAVFQGESGVLYSLRAFSIGSRREGNHEGHVMVLVERVVGQHAVNLTRAREKYSLSERETQVVSLVTQGLSNKEIGARLFVCEYTIKDHLKNIMRKLGVSSRSAISPLLK